MFYKLTCILLLISLPNFSQNITGLVVDDVTGEPIPFVTIKTGTYTGEISNNNGNFSINLETVTDNITFSCVGYENKTITFKNLKVSDFIVKLTPDITQLDDVYISNKRPNANKIIAAVRKNLSHNYDNTLKTHEFFTRNTNITNFKKLTFKIEKASQIKSKNIAAANTNLNALAKSVKSRNIIQFEDFQVKLHVLDKDSTKLQILKGTIFFEADNAFSIDQIQDKAQNIILKYLDTTKTYKLKSGLFKIEDSLSLKSKKNNKRKADELTNINREIRNNFSHSSFYENSFLNNFLNTKSYTYTYNDAFYKTNDLIHAIKFAPKSRKAKYTGTLYINDATYAVTRVDYSFDENQHGQKLNFKLLLGFKYSEDASYGTIIFEKDSSAIYQPKYLNHSSGNYFYIKRDIKVIENSESKNKVNFSFKLEGTNTNKTELLFTKNSNLNLQKFENVSPDKIIPSKRVFKRENTVWDSKQNATPNLLLKTLEN